MKQTIAAGIAVLALSLAACTPTVQEANSDLCTSMAAVGTAVESAKSIGPASTIDEVQATKTELEDAWAGVASSAATLDEAQYKATEDAFNQMTSTIGGISDQDTLAQAAATVQVSVTAFETAFEVIHTSACPGQ